MRTTYEYVLLDGDKTTEAKLNALGERGFRYVTIVTGSPPEFKALVMMERARTERTAT